MFTALALICGIQVTEPGVVDGCMIGYMNIPYKTVEKCEERLEFLVENRPKFERSYVADAKCVPLKVGQAL